jgi:FkbM family methyltransferase
MSLLQTLKFITSHPLNRRDKLRSIIRFARWQLGSRLAPGTIVFDWINGSKFLVKPGETGLTGNIYAGLHEFPEMGFLLHFLRRDDLFVDVGANVGSYTILASAAVGSRSIAFEPVPDTYKRLVENIRLNHLDDKARCMNKGVGDQPGEIAFTTDSDTVNHALADDERCENQVVVEVTSLDIALRDEDPALIKIDVEGYETLVMKGAKETLRKETLHAVIMELNGSSSRYGFEESRLVELILGNGFAAYSYNPLDRTLLRIEGRNLDSGNTLFIRDREFVEQRLRGSPKLTVYGTQF